MRHKAIGSSKSFYKNLFKKFLALAVLMMVCYILYPEGLMQRLKVFGHNLYSCLLVKSIEINGNALLPDKAVISAISVKIPSMINNIDLNAVKEVLEKNTQIKFASAKFKIPSTLSIQVVERIPYALWWQENRFFLIDMDGVVLKKSVNRNEYNDLLVIVGNDANMAMGSILKYFQNTQLLPKITSLRFISNRRWDLVFDDGMIVKLPEVGVENAIKSLEDLLLKDDFYEKPEIIDLRLLPEKIFIKFGK